LNTLDTFCDGTHETDLSLTRAQFNTIIANLEIPETEDLRAARLVGLPFKDFAAYWLNQKLAHQLSYTALSIEGPRRI